MGYWTGTGLFCNNHMCWVIQDDRFLLMYDMVVLNCVEVDSDDSTCSFRFTCTVYKYDCFLINITVFHSGDCKSNFHYSIPTKPSG